jgi:hypothetical protein
VDKKRAADLGRDSLQGRLPRQLSQMLSRHQSSQALMRAAASTKLL